MLLKIIKKTLLFIPVLLLFLLVWFYLEFYFPPKTASKEIVFEVGRGKNAKDISKDLKERGIIRKKWVFLIGNTLFFTPQTLKAGEYSFQVPVSVKDVLSTITEGKVYLHSVTIPEGLIREETARLLESLHFIESDEFLESSRKTDLISSLDKEALDLEGYLFPETYRFPKDTPANKIVSTMVSQFMKVFGETWKSRADEIGMTIREVVILASLIEKETSLPEERPLVSSVLHNRLQIGMKLDCDPTIIYAFKLQGVFKERLLFKDLKYDSPYNTYLHAGLPPGPIANPGRDSLHAALFPTEGKFLYFVSKNDGSHHFSQTFREHQRAVIKYQRNK